MQLNRVNSVVKEFPGKCARFFYSGTHTHPTKTPRRYIIEELSFWQAIFYFPTLQELQLSMLLLSSSASP